MWQWQLHFYGLKGKRKGEAAGKGDLRHSRIRKRGTNRDGNVERKRGWVIYEVGNERDGDLGVRRRRTHLKRAGTWLVWLGSLSACLALAGSWLVLCVTSDAVGEGGCSGLLGHGNSSQRSTRREGSCGVLSLLPPGACRFIVPRSHILAALVSALLKQTRQPVALGAFLDIQHEERGFLTR